MGHDNTHQGLGAWTRDGHLSDLGIDQILRGELPREGAVQAHLDSCEDCARRLAEVQRFNAEFEAGPLAAPAWLATLSAHPASAEASLPPSEASLHEEGEGAGEPQRTEPLGPMNQVGGAVISLAQAREAKRAAWSRAAVGGLLAAAAVAIVVMSWPSPEPGEGSGPDRLPGVWDKGDGIRIKGRLLNLRLFANASGETRAVVDRGVVHPGERIGFQLKVQLDSHVMIVGVDERDSAYLCYPQNNGGDAQAFKGSASAVTLDEAMRLDDVLGQERIVAIMCPEPFQFEAIREPLVAAARQAGAGAMPRVMPDCLQQEVRLAKERP